MTSTDIKIARHEAQARIASIEAEKEFLKQLLSVPLDSVVDRIKNRLRLADVHIGAEQEYIRGLNQKSAAE